MNHGSINNYAYNAGSDNGSNYGYTYAAQQQHPNSNVIGKHLPFLSSAASSQKGVPSPPANGDSSPSNPNSLFFNNFFESNTDLPKNSSLAQTTAAKQQQQQQQHRHNRISPSRVVMADAGELPQTDVSHTNDALHKLRQKLGGNSSSHISPPVNNNLLHDIPDYNTRFPHYLSNFSANNNNPSSNIYNANNASGNTNIRWPTQPTTNDNAVVASAYASSSNSRQSGGDNSSRAAEQLPLLPTSAAPANNNSNKFSFSSAKPVAASSSMPAAPPPTIGATAGGNTKSSSSAFVLQQKSPQTTTVGNSLLKIHQSSKTTKNVSNATTEKLPQICALADSLQSVSSASLINNNRQKVDSYYSSANALSSKEVLSDTDAVLAGSSSTRNLPVHDAAHLAATSSKRSSEFLANDLTLPLLLSKLNASTTRKRSMNEEASTGNAALAEYSSLFAADRQQHLNSSNEAAVSGISNLSAVAALSNLTNANQQQTDEAASAGTTQKKSRFRIGSLAVNRKASIAATETTAAAVLPVVVPVQHHAHTLPALHTTATHAKKASHETFDAVVPATAAASTSSGHNSLLSSSSKIGVDDDDLQQQSPQRNRVMSPNTAIRKYGSRLSNYELGEIKNYSKIYFVGQRADKIDASSTKSRNYGCDNEEGLYLLRRRDQIAYRFEIIDKLGQGSFGQVVRAYDHKDGIEVALKILRNRRKFYRQGLVEVKLLEIVKRKDGRASSSEPSSSLHNVVHMLNHFIFRNHLCISFELLGSNLYEVLQKNHFQGFNIKAVRNIAHQILACLQLLRREHIIHCDLKPENILINPNRPDSIAVKVVDFGSGCLDNQKLYTYIQSRYYRSPEVIMGLTYTMSIDMWSLGCILCELHTGRPLFPGEDEDEQLSMMMEVLGVPPQGVIAQGTRSSRFFDSCGQPIRMVNSRGRKRVPGSKELSRAICATDKSFIDFLLKSFSYDSDTRLTPDEGLRHEFITSGAHHTQQHSATSTSGVASTLTRTSGVTLASSSSKVGGATTKNWTAKSGR